jgi:hypothetical protein
MNFQFQASDTVPISSGRAVFQNAKQNTVDLLDMNCDSCANALEVLVTNSSDHYLSGKFAYIIFALKIGISAEHYGFAKEIPA